jgi:2-methylcitrate dehydratase PrpD
LKARKELALRYDEIKSVRVQTYRTALQLTGNQNPKNAFEAKFSMPYCIATALMYGKVDEQQFEEDVLFDKQVRSLIAKIRLEASPELEEKFPDTRPVVIELKTEAGNHRIENYYRKGDPENPLSRSELEDKFGRLTSGIIESGKAGRIIDTVFNMDSQSDILRLSHELMVLSDRSPVVKI